MKIGWSDRRLLLILVFAGVILLHLLTLLRYPPPFVDEAWLVSRAWGFLQTGHQFGPLDSGLIEQRYAGYWTVNQWLITALQALVLRFFSHPELLPLRVLSLVEGFGLLTVSYWAATRLSGKTVAICSTLLLAISRIFMHTAHMVRYDILATFFGYTALAVIVNDRRGRFWSGLAAGVLAGLAVETHLNSLIFFPMLGLYYLVEYGGKVYRKACLWGFALGSGIGVAFYLALHVLPYPDTYRRVNMLLFSKTQATPILSINLQNILRGFGDATFLLLLGSGPMLLLGLLAIPLLVRRGTRLGWELLTINMTLWVGAALIFPNSMGHYAIYLTPAFLWLVAEFLVDFVRKPWQGRIRDFASRAIVWGVVIGALALSVELLIPNGYHNYLQAQKQVNAAVQPSDTIMGPQVYWLGLYDHRYYSWELLFLYPRFYPGKTLADAFEHYVPDLLIIDGNMEPYINDSNDTSNRWYYYRVSRKELYDYLDSHAHQVSMLDHVSYYGSEVKVYRLTWMK